MEKGGIISQVRGQKSRTRLIIDSEMVLELIAFTPSFCISVNANPNSQSRSNVVSMQQIRSLKQQEGNVSISNKFQGITSRLMSLGTEQAYFME